VRGIWKDIDYSTPLILAKSCHDLDILYWLTGARAVSVAASGERSWFRAENTPVGATDRCTDGCPHLATCPFSAVDIYLKKNLFLHHLDVRGSATGKEAHILNRLETTDYGRCVYKLENTQPDHFSLMIDYENGVSAALSVQGLTSIHGRRTQIFGGEGDLHGDHRSIVATRFRSNNVLSYDPGVVLGGHGGGDAGLMYDWVRAVHYEQPELLSSGVVETLQSHAIGFAAEASRVSKTREQVSVEA
jgi:predicted dehydrogenase